jgi:luciferase family oxidoreductase group 1
MGDPVTEKRLMIPLSILDLAPVCEGSDTTAAFANMLELAQHADALGYRRYWLAEHHNMPGIASAATAVLIGHVAGGTRRIRVGAGGIMLPNHAPLQVAEQFGTLASLYPDRIDLGLGRAPGTDQPTARALRRYFDSADQFPQDVRELLHTSSRCSPGRRCRRFRAAACGCRPGSWVPACSARAWPPRWACRMRSPRTSRPTRWTKRWRSTAASSAPRPR